MYWTKSPGTGGHVASEEDFIVEEIPLKKFFAKFTRGSIGVSRVEGPYTLALLKKKWITTKDALSLLEKKLNIRKEDIGYAGLKDKFAVTSQYLTIKGPFQEIKTDKIELTSVGFTDKMMQVGELEGNRFSITLRNCRNPKNASSVIEEMKARGMPNYFGVQRFGIYGNNHVIGLLLLRRDFKKALDLINKQSKGLFKSINAVEKRKLKFYLHSYQSFLFNRLLGKYISRNSMPFFGDFPIAGFDTRLKGFAGKETKKLLEKDKISLEDFSIRELGLKVIGSSRHTFVKVEKIGATIDGKTLKLDFELPKGSYATVLIVEVAKN